MTTTNTPFDQRQREVALEFAPPEEISEKEFVYRASFYALPTIRLASMRYGAARGRTYGQVMARFVEHLRNPHLNRGDDFRVALGHIEATRRREQELGL